MHIFSPDDFFKIALFQSVHEMTFYASLFFVFINVLDLTELFFITKSIYLNSIEDEQYHSEMVVDF